MLSTFLVKRHIPFKLLCKTWEEYGFPTCTCHGPESTTSPDCPCWAPTGTPSYPGHQRDLFQPSLEPTAPAPGILHECWSSTLSNEWLYWFVHPALAVVSEHMFRVMICSLGLREREFQHPGTGGWENPLAGAALAPVGLEEQSHVPKDHCIQLSVTELLFTFTHVMLLLSWIHICFNFRHFMLFACWCPWLGIQYLVEKSAQWW